MARFRSFVLLGAALAGCASAPTITVANSDAMGAAQTAVRLAEEEGAKNDSKASQYLQMATEELQQGRLLMQNGRGRSVELFQRAQADAEVSLAHARAARARADLKNINDKLSATTPTGAPAPQQQQPEPPANPPAHP